MRTKPIIVYLSMVLMLAVSGCQKDDVPQAPNLPKTYTGTPSRNFDKFATEELLALGDLTNFNIDVYMIHDNNERKLPYYETTTDLWSHHYRVNSNYIEVFTSNTVSGTTEGRIYPPALRDSNRVQWRFKIIIQSARSAVKRYGYPMDRSALRKLETGD